jgi:hypothetical protein
MPAGRPSRSHGPHHLCRRLTGYQDRTTQDLEGLLGRRPMTFEAFTEADASAESVPEVRSTPVLVDPMTVESELKNTTRTEPESP